MSRTANEKAAPSPCFKEERRALKPSRRRGSARYAVLPRVLMELLAQMEARSMAKEAGDFLDTLPRPDGWTGSWTSGVLAAGRPQERVVSLDGQPGPGKRAGAERHHAAAWPPPRPSRCAARLARDARPCVNWNRSFKISIFFGSRSRSCAWNESFCCSDTFSTGFDW